jgi:hypothetical protein
VHTPTGGTLGNFQRLVPLYSAATRVLGPPAHKAGGSDTHPLRPVPISEAPHFDAHRLLPMLSCWPWPQDAAAPDFTHQHDVQQALWLSKAPAWVARLVAEVDRRPDPSDKVHRRCLYASTPENCRWATHTMPSLLVLVRSHPLPPRSS